MTEEEKLDAGLYYDFWDAGVNGRKLNAIRFVYPASVFAIDNRCVKLVKFCA